MKVHVTLGEGMFISVETKEGIPDYVLRFLLDVTKYFIDATIREKMDKEIVSTAMHDPNIKKISVKQA